MQKICILIPIWKREWLTKALLKYYNKFQSDDIQYDIVVIGSEGEKSREIAEGLYYVETSNDLLDQKYDEGFQFCQQFNPDVVAFVGSDDFITKDYFDWSLQQINNNISMVGLLDFYIVDLPTKKIYYWKGYVAKRKGYTIASRIFSKEVLDKIKWSPYITNGQYIGNQHDDERAQSNIINVGGQIKAINMNDIGCRYWAVKTGNEINKTSAFHNLVDVTDNCKQQFESDVEIKL